ncbi:hypothetical protein ACFO0M_10260 [Micromonospora mangrovi]|uniref:Integrase n=2 Tax=Micromonospora TaxID=1873 RepID=A0AAU7M8H9_9ACTN
MATPIRTLLRRLAGQPDPVPPGTGQRIQEAEQRRAKQLLLESNRIREHRWSR